MVSYIRSLTEGAVSLNLIGSFIRTKERIQGVVFFNYREGPFAERVYQLLDWMNSKKWDGKPETKKTSRPNFMTLYLDEPDHTGHSHGPYDDTGELDKKSLEFLYIGIWYRFAKIQIIVKIEIFFKSQNSIN